MTFNRRRSNVFLLLTALARHLNHEVRTPLAVLSNDLFYFSDRLPKEDSERALRKCSEIAAILKAPLMLSGRSAQAGRSVDLKAVVQERCADVPVFGEASPVDLEPELCGVLMWGVKDAFRVLAPLDRIVLRSEGPVTMVTVEGNSPWNVPVEKQHNHTFDSMTKCISQYLQRDSLGAILVDAIVEELGAVLELELFPSTIVRIALPTGGEAQAPVSQA
jgi:hypothetical protein